MFESLGGCFSADTYCIHAENCNTVEPMTGTMEIHPPCDIFAEILNMMVLGPLLGRCSEKLFTVGKRSRNNTARSVLLVEPCGWKEIKVGGDTIARVRKPYQSDGSFRIQRGQEY
jgi:hypothetical protein